MLKKFALWFICFGLSFLVQNLGWAPQGEAFLILDLGLSAFLIAVVILICLVAGSGVVERIGMPIVALLAYTAVLGIILFATWGATQLFKVDFYVAYQIMTFGQCLCQSSKKDD